MPRRNDGSYVVYGLADPASHVVFYVGKGRPWRPSQHLRDARRWEIDRSPLDASGNPRNIHKVAKIAKILRHGGKPEVVIYLTTFDEGLAYQEERRLVKELRLHLTNLKDGGGPRGAAYSEESRRRMGHFRGKRHSEESRRKMSLACRGYRHTDEAKAKISEALKKRVRTEATRLKLVAARKHYRISDETKEKIRRSLQGRRLPSEVRAKISASNKGRRLTPEQVARLRYPRSTLTRQRMLIGQLRRRLGAEDWS